jgi:formylglycine-generating enzyme required for sulfatase activity
MMHCLRILSMPCMLFACLAAAGSVQGGEFRDCPDCPPMIAVPAGSFQMGTTGRPSQAPMRTVTLTAFAIGKYEVTQGEWKALMGDNPARFAACGDTCPVERVSWQDAGRFVERLRAKTGKAYRLPSEAEWEYACRAGNDHEWCAGNDVSAVAWIGNLKGGPRPVGGKRPNAWGLHDMSGNVWEWTQDCAHADYLGAPADGTAWETDGDCASRMLRGGSWLSGPQYGRIGIRFGFSADYRTGDFGFRVVRPLD